MKKSKNLEVRSEKGDQDSSFALPHSHFSLQPPGLVPKLRFPEFRGTEGWPQSELGRNATILKGKGISKADLDPNGSQACIRYGELYTRYGETISKAVSRTNVPVSELFLSKPDDVIIPSSGETKIDIAKASCVLAGGIALGGDLNVIRSKLNGTFLSYFLNGPKRFEIAKVAQGDTVVHLYPHQLEALQIATPSPAEQQKIAECLSSVDEVIAAQARKLDALKTHKKGLMQQLFPREGETQPRLRFPEFQNAGDWEVKPFDKLVTFQSGGTPSKANPAFWNGSVPWVSAKDMKQLFLDDAEDHISAAAVDEGAKVVPAGTLLMLVRGMTLLKDVPICVVLREMSFNQDVKALRPVDGVDGLFLALLLTGSKDRLLEMVTIAGHGTGKLDTDELKAMALMLPKPAEQHRIATCLSSLDALIAAETQKHAALQRHKRGLMQQLFPTPEQ